MDFLIQNEEIVIWMCGALDIYFYVALLPALLVFVVNIFNGGLDDVTHCLSLRWGNVVKDAQDSWLIQLPGKCGVARLIREIKKNLSREVQEDIECIPPTCLPKTDIVTSFYRMLLTKDDLDQVNYFGLIIATSLGHIRAMRQYLENGVKPTGPGQEICIAPLLVAMRVGPRATKLLLEYGALSTNKANMLLETDYVISAPLAVIKTLVAAGHTQSLSFLRLEQSVRKIQHDNVEAQRKMEDIKALLRQPRSLDSLARQAVVRSLGPMPGRRRKMSSTELPVSCQEELCIADRIDLSMAVIDDKAGSFHIVAHKV